MLDKYKETYDEIEVPKDLILKTSLKMKEEQEKNESKKFNWFSKPLIFGLASACILIIVVAINMLGNNNYIQTKLYANKSVENVELRDGTLTFEESKELSESSIMMGNSSKLKAKIGSVKDANTFLKNKIDFDTIMEDFYQSEKAILYYNEANDVKNAKVTLNYTNEDKRVNVLYGIDELEKSNSKMNGTDLYLEYNDSMKTYDASFVKNGILYTVSTKNYTQEMFIELLASMIEK